MRRLVSRCKGRRSLDEFSNGDTLCFINDQAKAGSRFRRIGKGPLIKRCLIEQTLLTQGAYIWKGRYEKP